MTILITDNYHPESIELLNQHQFHVVQASEITNYKAAQALLIRSKTIIDAKLLAQMPQLKFIASATSGLDHIDIKACHKNNILIFNPKTVNSISAAEHTWALILNICKKIQTATLSSNHRWKTNLVRGLDLHKKTLGIIGLGQVGNRVARIAQAFNMKVMAYDPYKDLKYFKEHKVKKIDLLSEIFEAADLVSLHTPITKETFEFINQSHFGLMKPNAILVNTSRGNCLHQESLITALNKNQIAGAALDVFNKEPLSNNSPLLTMSNVLLTPHIGAFTEDAFKIASLECATWLIEVSKT